MNNVGELYLEVLSNYFFFSSRKRHTTYWRDWSSDVFSSDLRSRGPVEARGRSDALRQADRRGRARAQLRAEIGRASCRERVQISVVAVSLKKKIQNE